MKKLQLLSLFLVSVFLVNCASMGHMSPEMREVVTIEDHELSKDEVFDQTMRWVASNYNSANDVVQLSDKENGTIIISAIHDITRAGITTFPLSYNMTIDLKDNKIRFTQRVGSPRDPGIGGVTQGDAEKMHQHFADLRSSLLSYYKERDDF